MSELGGLRRSVVGEAGPDKTTVTVSTKLKFGLTGWGKLKKNLNRVFDSLDRSLGF